MTAQLLTAARALQPEIRRSRDDMERERRLPPALVEKLREAQLCELWLPRVFGGPELPPDEYVAVIEALASADGSVGWCAGVASTFSQLAGYLREDIAQKIFGDHRIVAGAFNPGGKAVPVAGGFRITGRWPFASGIQQSSWLLGSCLVEGGTARFFFFPTSAAEVIDTWVVSGMRATGSHDFQVQDLFVADDDSIPAYPSLATQQGTLYRIPLLSLSAMSLAAVSLGIARTAIDALIELAAVKTPIRSTAPLREKPSAQAAVGRAEALLWAARAGVFEAMRQQWDEVAAGGSPALRSRARVRLACTYCAEACASAVDLVYAAAGGSALYESGPIARCFRDVHAATQHIALSANNYEVAGGVSFGFDPGSRL